MIFIAYDQRLFGLQAVYFSNRRVAKFTSHLFLMTNIHSSVKVSVFSLFLYFASCDSICLCCYDSWTHIKSHISLLFYRKCCLMIRWVIVVKIDIEKWIQCCEYIWNWYETVLTIESIYVNLCATRGNRCQLLAVSIFLVFRINWDSQSNCSLQCACYSAGVLLHSLYTELGQWHFIDFFLLLAYSLR